MHTWLTRALVAAILALAAVVAGDALRQHDRAMRTSRATSPVREPVRRLPECGQRSLALSIEVLGGSATAVLRRPGGAPCRLRRVPVRVAVADWKGRPVGLSPSEQTVAGTFSPGFERLLDITFLPSCAARGPYSVLATVGPYAARETLSRREIGCYRGG